MHSRSPGYERLNHWCTCQICGFDYRANEMMKTYDGKLVCKYDYETRHPQELIKGKKDTIAPVGIVTGEPTDTFTTVTYTYTPETVPSGSFNTSVL